MIEIGPRTMHDTPIVREDPSKVSPGRMKAPRFIRTLSDKPTDQQAVDG